jgi:hypothetical protein
VAEHKVVAVSVRNECLARRNECPAKGLKRLFVIKQGLKNEYVWLTKQKS